MIRLLTLVSASLAGFATFAFAEQLAHDKGASGVWQKLTKLTTTASLLHIKAHPDDEHGGMLTLSSRGQGVRVSLLSLTPGEAGAIAIGPELFDDLGSIRAEELTLAGRYCGLDALYFTRLADYGYSTIALWGPLPIGSWRTYCRSRDGLLARSTHLAREGHPVIAASGCAPRRDR